MLRFPGRPRPLLHALTMWSVCIQQSDQCANARTKSSETRDYCFFSQDRFQALFFVCVVDGDGRGASDTIGPVGGGVASSSSTAEAFFASELISPSWRFGLGMSSDPPRLPLVGGTPSKKFVFCSLKLARRAPFVGAARSLSESRLSSTGASSLASVGEACAKVGVVVSCTSSGADGVRSVSELVPLTGAADILTELASCFAAGLVAAWG